MSRYPPLVVLVVILVLSGCSGPSEAEGESGPSAESDPQRSEETPDVAQYETFDASKYEVRLPEETAEIDHQVPERLLRGRADEEAKQTLQGFRVQVFSALEKQAAQDFREKVRRWWENSKEEAPESVFTETTPIDIVYSQPYYRVRIGAFARRSTADKALQFVRKRFESAFIARSTVTVTQ